jgi:hypothetical protein
MAHHTRKHKKHTTHTKHKARSQRKNRHKPTLKHNAYRILEHYVSQRPQRSMRNIHYSVMPVLPKHRSPLKSAKKNRMAQEPSRIMAARSAKSAYQERKELEALVKQLEKEEEKEHKQKEKEEKKEKEEQKAAQAATMSNLNDLFARMNLRRPNNNANMSS